MNDIVLADGDLQFMRRFCIDENLDVLSDAVLLVDHSEANAWVTRFQIGENGQQSFAIGVDTGGAFGVTAQWARYAYFHLRLAMGN